MNLQEGFDSDLLKTSSLYDRMFHYKPYTKCVDCLTNQRLKCKKCMQQMINDMQGKRLPRNVPKLKMRSTLSNLYNTFGQTKKQNTLKTMVTSKYDWWLEEKRKRRSMDIGVKDNWPKKIKQNDINLQKLGAKQPKFLKWQKKLLDKLISKTKGHQQ